MSLIADVFNVLLIDKDTNDVIAQTLLQDANIDVSVDENEVRGGQGNGLIAILRSARDIQINLTDPTFNYEALARQLGQTIQTGAGIAYAMPKVYDVTDGGTSNPVVTLDKTPNATDHGVAAYTIDGKKITGFTVTGDKVDFTSASPTVNIGDKVEIRTFKFDTDAATESIDIDVKSFGKGVQVVLETLEIDEDEQPKNVIQYQFDTAIPNGNFTINTSSAREASAQEMALRVLKPKDSDVVGRVLRFPVA